MPIVSPTTPSSTNAVTPTSLQTTLNDRAFYVYSGPVVVPSSETTMLSVNDIGKRDILFCLEAGGTSSSGDDFIIKVKVNGQVIFGQRMEESTVIADGNDLKFIIPANCSLEVTLESSSGSRTWYVAGYGNYL
jgi:hypothetical protein